MQLPLAPGEMSLTDKVSLYYAGKGALTKAEQKKLKRWETAFGFLMSTRSKLETVKQLEALYNSNGEPISERQIWRDVAEAEKVFVPISKIEKETHRLMTIQSATRDIDRVEKWIQDCLTKGAEQQKELLTLDVFEKLMAIKDKAERRIIKAAGLEDYTELPDFSKLKANEFTVNIPEPILKSLVSLMEKGAVNATLLYEELMNNSEDAEIVED